MSRSPLLLCVTAATLAACATTQNATTTEAPNAPTLTLASRRTATFYDVLPNELVGPPGSIIRYEPMPIVIGSSFDANFPAARMYRVLYRTTGLKNEPAPASAVLIIPEAQAPRGGHPVVAWAHGTSGVYSQCAPSLSRDVARTIPGLSDLLTGGAVVVAPDYPGLGTQGPHPYLVKISEGRAVLDAVRAARAFPDSQASTRFIPWGHSQGGHAALAAAELAEGYAPDLHLVGVTLAAPATELPTLLSTPVGKPLNDPNIAGLFLAWSRVYGMPVASVVRPEDVPNVQRLGALCTLPPWVGAVQRVDEPVPKAPFIPIQDIATSTPWRELVTENSSVALRGVPVFIARGGADRVIPPISLGAYRAELCSAGSPVKSLALPGVTHNLVARDAAPQAVEWMLDRFAGQRAPNDCVSTR